MKALNEAALDSLYDPLVEPARERLETCRALREVFAPSDTARLARFLLYFSAYGVGMTDSVADWIRGAGERCVALDWPELGKALCAHARHEEGHEQLMINDLRMLADWYQEHHAGTRIDPDALLTEPHPPGVRAYRELHEEVIASTTPFAQIAIEYEIEALSVRIGPRFLQQIERALGPSVVRSLSFVQEHVALDVGHTRFNRLELARLVDLQPALAQVLAVAGARALDAYRAFLDDCWSAASQSS